MFLWSLLEMPHSLAFSPTPCEKFDVELGKPGLEAGEAVTSQGPEVTLRQQTQDTKRNPVWVTARRKKDCDVKLAICEKKLKIGNFHS